MQIPWIDLVDAQPALDHVQGLYAKGMSVQSMAEQTGLSDRTIRGYVNGWIQKGYKKHPVVNCLPETSEKILAIMFVPGWTAEGFRRDKLRALRESKGLSRIALGTAARVDPSTIQYWENGRSMPLRKLKLDAVLAVLDAEWEDVSGPDVPDDEFRSMVIADGVCDVDQDFTNDYPCHVCGGIFRSRLTLATHPHQKAKVSA